MTHLAIEIDRVSVKYRQYESASRSIKTELLTGKSSNSRAMNSISDLSIDIRPGEIVGVIGKNGAGKSTFAKLIMGIVKPTSGRIIVRGSTTGLLQLGSGLNLDRTARENITFINHLRTRDSKNINKVLDEVIEWASLHKEIDKPLRTYSSGMLARFSFALETYFKPEIFVIDEVLSVGDFEFQHKSSERMRSLITSGATVVLVSHDLDSISQFCGSVMWLEGGKLKKYGNPLKVIESYKGT